ncbi:hypothetical protein EDL79_01525 [Ehrlichia ruminantium]|uniref:Uncharacterized protein n=1 Tax=Ehrlichia ruminantium TaxID=779 RepID=A0AAE6QB08_EHRRU|nr:hypothetical protein [Ehrlichia ruminantium]QGR02357.1 hypothetical protein EDL81_01530 [Ehrlichia ruminantium]QGR03276.1 hypothetical protein EDL80_01525 [Ehrlichia ruminantium]QGR04201.1 hypothetical protein EDL79_01525 [Ehrlichia ruminantium]
MNKITSNISLIILFPALISVSLLFFKLRQHYNNIAFYVAFAITLACIGISFIIILINRIKHIKGISIQDQSKSEALNLNLSQQSGIFIPIPLSELSKINSEHNILEYHTKPIDDNLTCIDTMCNLMNASIMQNQGLFGSRQFKPSKAISRIDLVTDENIINKIKNDPNSTGIFITTKSNISEQIIKDSIKVYNHASIKNGKLLISFINLKTCTNTQKIAYTIEEFDILLQSQATHNLGNPKLTIYDIMALDTLQKCPDTIFNDQEPWFNTQEGKIAIMFFRMFNKQHTFHYNNLPISNVEHLKTKIKTIQEYIENNATIEYPDNYNITTYISNKIKSIYLTKSADTNDYAHLYKNRHITHTCQWVHNLIHIDIRCNELLKYIYTLATYEKYDTNDKNINTNAFIRKILEKEDKVDISEIITRLNSQNIIQCNTNFKNKNLSKLLHTLLNDNKTECTITELITYAREYIMNRHKKYMLCYIEKKQNLTVEIENITLFSPEGNTTHLPTNIQDTTSNNVRSYIAIETSH